MREIRETKKYTQLYIAQKLGISQPRYNQLEQNGHLSAEQLVRLSEVLDTSLDILTEDHRPCREK